jgi:hypothetical protein
VKPPGHSEKTWWSTWQAAAADAGAGSASRKGPASSAAAGPTRPMEPGAVLPEDEAERVAHRVREDPEAGLPLGRESAGAECQHRLLRRVDVIDADVHMQLLGAFGVGPAWGYPTYGLSPAGPTAS